VSAPNVAALRRALAEAHADIERRAIAVLELQEQVRALEARLTLRERYIAEKERVGWLQPAWRAGA
jgi:hypothetical protein